MTLSTVQTANVVKQWDADFYREYIRDNRFARYQGTDVNSIIQLKEDLTKKPGDALTLSLVAALSGAGVTGNALLEGAEEAMLNYGHQITIQAYRNAVALTEWEEQKTAMGLRKAAKPILKEWAMQLNKTHILNALGSVRATAGTIVNYGSATEAQKDQWLQANLDRVLFGATLNNTDGSGGDGGGADHSDSLLAIANTEKLTAAQVSLYKRMAKRADPIIRPVRVNGDEEWYVLFVDSLAYRDLKADLKSTLADARERGKGNPLFTDGDITYDGVIIREIPEIASLGGVGDSGATISPVYLCGAQALGHVIGKRWASVTEERDYKFVNGVAVAGFFGIEKLFFNAKQHGVLTGYVAAAADA
ncbi:DUF4043 family protein [Pseudoxanthomonas koreensis]|uniref:phage capsid family protein n=1 Tax=Pseudoxanthomonas koreensis TaxID=266061 RepID=UPI0013917C00|nr:DUF4043 family protein [Pseudoxanthomonas koreensis]KAF1692657.1 hypothetical protein CSC64_06625 [Pseudoxanthomonas koreensis]